MTPEKDERTRLLHRIDELERKLAAQGEQLQRRTDALTREIQKNDQEIASHKECHSVFDREKAHLNSVIDHAYDALGSGAPYVVVSAQEVAEDAEGQPRVVIQLGWRQDLTEEFVEDLLEAAYTTHKNRVAVPAVEVAVISDGVL